MALKLVVLCCLTAYTCAFSGPPVHVQPLGDFFKFNRVIGGKVARRGEFPHQVSLRSGLPPLIPYDHMCGGSIISQRWVLTAAHCVSTLPEIGHFIVTAGKISIETREYAEQSTPVAEIFVHEGYNGSISPYDIALIKVLIPFTYNKYVKPISLPEPNVLPQGYAILSGWGSISKTEVPIMPDLLQKAKLPIVDLETCRTAMRLLGEPWTVDDMNVCTGPLTGEMSACNGDSGGPLIKVYENGAKEIVGIVSWGVSPCAKIGAPAVFVRVSAFIDWINFVIQSFS